MRRNTESATVFDGLTGPAVFKRFIVRIDYAARTLTFIRPGNFKATEADTAVPFTFEDGRIPEVEGSIDGLTGQFEIDTGSRAALSLLAPFVKAHDFNANYRTIPKTVTGWGVGGSVKGQVTRGGRLMIGNVPVHDPVVELSAATKGAMTDKNIADNIGGEILKRFTVTFDYANQRMYLKPNKNYGAPMNYDRSGMWTNGRHGDSIVKYVMAGWSAYRAGLKVGDVITAVNGKPATTLTLSGLRGMLRNGIPGSRVKLALGKDGRARTVTLVLRRLILRTEALKKTD